MRSRSSGVARSSDGLVNVAWAVLHCNRRIGAREPETADTTCALSGSISGAGKSIEIRLRMCGPPLYTNARGDTMLSSLLTRFR